MKIPSSKDDISSYVERQNTIETYFCLLIINVIFLYNKTLKLKLAL